jgi:uncharacterized damage-inducible protein DinB
MGQKQLIQEFQQARATLLNAIAGLTEEDFLRPGAVGYWSVKDVLAHLTAWESELVTALVRIENKQKGAPHIVKIDDIDEWNEEQYHQNAARPFDLVWEDFVGVGKHLVEAIHALDDNTLDNNRLFHWMEGEPLAYLIYENAIWHEQEHAEEIRAWRTEVLKR